ncbi:peptidoglycan-binding protein [Pseudomonadota bacterium]
MIEFVRVRWRSSRALIRVLLVTPVLAGVVVACAPVPKKDADQGVASEAQNQTAETAPAAVQDVPTDMDELYRLGVELGDSDPETAAMYFEGAALQGHGGAAFRMGELQSKPKRAVEWYSMAAAMDQVEAQYALGDAYLNGRGTAKEPAWGLSWLERAARGGHAKAQFAMGVALATGMTGGPQREEAMVWLLIAQDNKYADAAPVISVLKARLKSQAIATAKERAAAWSNEASTDGEARAHVRYAQHALNRLGFDAGLADGITGDRTTAAVTAFRQSQGLAQGPGEGGIDTAMLERLRERLAILNR